MMKKYLFLLLNVLLGILHAESLNWDVYGVDPAIQKKILACCETEFREYELMQKQLFLSPKNQWGQIARKEMELEQSILKKINQLGVFRFSQLSSIYYPTLQTWFTTVDLVNASDLFRLPASSKRVIKKNLAKPQELTQLFVLWDRYTQENLKLMRDKKLKQKPCPFAHCIWGFDKKERLLYAPKFKHGAEKYKHELMELIEHSTSFKERGTAIYLLAHGRDYKELVRFLIKFSNDSSATVRNSSMRVLGAVLSKHEVQGLDIERVLEALNYPLVTDRNKAAYILWKIVRKDKLSHPLIIKKSGAVLINLLKLKQPNNHKYAYLVLKAISNQNYADSDYQRWEQWINSEIHKLT